MKIICVKAPRFLAGLLRALFFGKEKRTRTDADPFFRTSAAVLARDLKQEKEPS